MKYKKIAVVTAITLTLVLSVLMLGGHKTRAAVGGPICSVPADYATIQAAVNDSGCATINVAAGTYNELVSIGRTVTINGAQATVDARTRAVPVSSESVVGTADGAFQIEADNVVIDGFTIQGVTNDPNVVGHGLVAGIWTNPGFSGTHGGHQIRNNIIQGNIIGIELDNDGSFQTKVQQNRIQNNNASGPDSGSGIDTNFGLTNAVIDSNTFAGNTNSGINNFNSGVNASVTVSNNEFAANRRAIGWSFATASQIINNNIHNSTDSATADVRLFGGVNGLTITCNDITNGAGRGIRIDEECGGSCPNSNITINTNNIAGNAVAGLVVDHLSYAGVLNAQGNWWGSATGPTIASNPGGTGDKIDDQDGVVLYSPFATSPNSCAPDQCPSDPNKILSGTCGCGVPDSPGCTTTKHECEQYVEQQKKDFDKQQEADKKAFDKQQETDKKNFDAQQKADKQAFDSTPHTPAQKKTFEDQQKAQKKSFDDNQRTAKKNFEDNQKAAKDAFEQQNKANKEQCKSLPN
jgi:hypothetical protein